MIYLVKQIKLGFETWVAVYKADGHSEVIKVVELASPEYVKTRVEQRYPSAVRWGDNRWVINELDFAMEGSE